MSLLPPHATPVEHALDGVAARLSGLSVPIPDLWDPWRCPTDLLAWLAWARGVVPWDASWPEDVRRACIEAAIPTHRRAGTAWALRRILSALHISLDIDEWWQRVPAGQPYTMTLTAYASRHLAGDSVLSPELYRTVREAVDATVPVRVHAALRVAAGWRAGLGAHLASRATTLARREVVPRQDTAQAMTLAAALSARPRAAVRRATQLVAQTSAGGQIGAGLLARPRSVLRITMEAAA